MGLPAFNGAQHLAEALESLLSQSYEDFGLVLVDDCSSDDTPTIAQRYAALDPRVVYERNPQRLGLVGSWRRTFEVAVERYGSLEYFCWASDHDIWQPAFLEALFTELEADAMLVGAFPLWIPISAEGEPLRYKQRYWDTTGIEDPLGRLRRVATGIPPQAGSVIYGLFRASAIERCGIFRSVLLPDWLLLAQLAVLGPLKQVPLVLWQRRRTTKATRKRSRQTLFPGSPPLHAYLPVPLVHAAVLLHWAVITGSLWPELGRLRGAAIPSIYLPFASWRLLRRVVRRRRRQLRGMPTIKRLLRSRKMKRKQRRKRFKVLRRKARGLLPRVRRGLGLSKGSES